MEPQPPLTCSISMHNSNDNSNTLSIWQMIDGRSRFRLHTLHTCISRFELHTNDANDAHIYTQLVVASDRLCNLKVAVRIRI